MARGPGPGLVGYAQLERKYIVQGAAKLLFGCLAAYAVVIKIDPIMIRYEERTSYNLMVVNAVLL